MPSSIIVNGLRIYKPGIYGTIDASALGGKGISNGNVAIVGDFPVFKHGPSSASDVEPLTFLSGRAVKSFANRKNLLDIAKVAFSPSTDSRVPGGAASLTYVNTRPNTQASSDGYAGFADEDGTDCLALYSRLWGPEGNKVLVKMSTNADDANALDVETYYNGESETFEGLQSGVVAELYYDGSDLTANVLSVDNSSWVWTWEIATTFVPTGAAQSVVVSPTEIVVSNGSVLSFKMVDGAAGGTTGVGSECTVTVVGLDELGAAQTVVWTETAPASEDFGSGAGVYRSTTDKWGRIDSVTQTTTDVNYNGTVTAKGTAFDLDTADFESVGEMVSLIDQNSAKGFHADGKSPQIGNIPAAPDTSEDTQAGGVDKQTAVDVQSPATCEIRADLWYVVTALDASENVACIQDSSGVKPPRFMGAVPALDDQTFLYGGTQESITSDSWDDALRSIEASDIQVVVIWDDTITYLKKGITHAASAALAGYERQAWGGAPKDKTITELYTGYSSLCNNASIALCGDEIQISDSKGKSVWREPMWFALMCASMQAGTSVATPLTNKRPDILDSRQKWDPVLDVGTGISKGLCLLTRDSLGWKIARSVTTYMEDDNPIYSEVSSWESAITSVRSLRASLDIQVGNPVYAGTAARLPTTVEGILDRQVSAGIIKAWRNVVVEDAGDSFPIGYELATVEPLNFIPVTAAVVRISSL